MARWWRGAATCTARQLCHLPPEAVQFLSRDRQWCQEQAGKIGPSCKALVTWLLTDRVLGWFDIADQDGKPIPFSATALAAFLRNELLRDTLLQGLVDASSGAHSKNSRPGLAGLPAPAQA